jgi:hypothetical protein
MCGTAVVQVVFPVSPNSLEHLSMSSVTLSRTLLLHLHNSARVFRRGVDVNIVLDETPKEEITHCQIL